MIAHCPRLDDTLLEALDAQAEREHASRSDVIRAAIRAYVACTAPRTGNLDLRLRNRLVIHAMKARPHLARLVEQFTGRDSSDATRWQRQVRLFLRHNSTVVMTGKLGASRTVIESKAWNWPVCGLRHPPNGDATGCYLWTGELQENADFFLPWHVAHALHRCPELAPLLELPPGSRFISKRRATWTSGTTTPCWTSDRTPARQNRPRRPRQ